MARILSTIINASLSLWSSAMDEQCTTCTAEGAPRAYTVPGLEFRPSPFDQEEPDLITFDPITHLAFKSPHMVKSLNVGHDKYDNCPFPRPADCSGDNFKGLAYTAPFRVLSGEGVKAVREIIAKNEHRAVSTARNPKLLRGLGYHSSFIRNFTFHTPFLDKLSAMSDDEIWPHDLQSNIVQINWGKIGNSQRPELWHLDSCDYVMVVLLSNATDMEGGELQVVRMADENEALRLIKADAIPTDLIDTVQYPGPGWAIFMQGSKIAHGVTPVLKALEDRMVLVVSYQSRDIMKEDKTVWKTFKIQDPPERSNAEFVRHVTWRARGQLERLQDRPAWSTETAETTDALRSVAAYLEHAAKLLEGEASEELLY